MAVECQGKAVKWQWNAKERPIGTAIAASSASSGRSSSTASCSGSRRPLRARDSDRRGWPRARASGSVAEVLPAALASFASA